MAIVKADVFLGRLTTEEELRDLYCDSDLELGDAFVETTVDQSGSVKSLLEDFTSFDSFADQVLEVAASKTIDSPNAALAIFNAPPNLFEELVKHVKHLDYVGQFEAAMESE